jgi:ribosomal protein S18 acetylase RimI-like enzyme
MEVILLTYMVKKRGDALSIMTDSHILDNVAWNSLTTTHRHLGKIGKIAAVYNPQISVIGGLKKNTLEAYAELGTLSTPGVPVAVIGFKIPEELTGWRTLQVAETYQMVYNEPIDYDEVEYVELTKKDVPEMMKLVEITKPGPFSPGTIKMGRYIGIRKNSELVAMGGERMKPEGYVEISGICTHPEYHGKGYGTAISGILTNAILEEGNTPFLHVFIQNQPAIKLYEKLGYATRKVIPVSAIMKQP